MLIPQGKILWYAWKGLSVHQVCPFLLAYIGEILSRNFYNVVKRWS